MTTPKAKANSKAKTPPVAPEQLRMLATPASDIDIPNYTNVMSPSDETLLSKGGSKGIALYDEVKRDGHVRSVLNKRILKVLSREWELVPGSDDPRDQEACEFVKGVLKKINFDRLCRHLLWATLYGFAAAEIEWTITPDGIVPKSIANRKQKRIVFDLDWNPRLLTRKAPQDGEPQPERKWIIHRVDADGADPYGDGLGKVLFWHVLFKREGVGFWAYFLEKFASPTPVAKYPLGTPPTEQQRLLANLIQLVQRGALVMPIGTDVEFLQNASSGAVTYEDWCRFWNEESSITVLGENLSTGVKGQGARAAVQTHDSISDMIADADSDLCSETVNESLITWLIEYNRPGCKPPTVWRPRPKNEAEIEDQKSKKADRESKQLGNLFSLAAKGFRPATGIEQAVSAITGEEYVFDEEMAKRFAPPAPVSPTVPGDPDQAPPQEGDPAEFAGDHDHGMGALAEQLDDAAQPHVTAWLARVRQELEAGIARGDSFAQFSDRLLEIFPELEIDQFGQIIGQGLIVAEATGRADVQDETE